ncbi:MAG: histone deacetylase family protein [Hyphomicrobiaceae bacterium]|nr:histone deacetylase family protein [Hyphomicrobiaceae bacterium]MCC0023097.1 histone deacetylase family protein [Hyphomicrobiaceae bacterium]
MTTLFVRQENGISHRTPFGHPERPERLGAVDDALSQDVFDPLVRVEAPVGDLSLASLVHDQSVLSDLQSARPAEGIRQIEADTYVSEGSLNAAATALGGALTALDAVMKGEVDNAFCGIRPPGHHAERNRSMGFCLVNSAAIAARVAQQQYGVERVAIVDFDVHHGNGTQDIFYDDPSVFYGSSHQMPLFPGSGAVSETGVGNVLNAPLDPMSDGMSMREAYTDYLLPALADFSPDLIIISAGFDAHRLDPLAQLNWVGSDYGWVTGKIMDIAEKHAANRIVSLLEGGYDLKGLAEGVANHVAMLLNGQSIKQDKAAEHG